jgi:hypothetical protein
MLNLSTPRFIRTKSSVLDVASSLSPRSRTLSYEDQAVRCTPCLASSTASVGFCRKEPRLIRQRRRLPQLPHSLPAIHPHAAHTPGILVICSHHRHKHLGTHAWRLQCPVRFYIGVYPAAIRSPPSPFNVRVQSDLAQGTLHLDSCRRTCIPAHGSITVTSRQARSMSSCIMAK